MSESAKVLRMFYVLILVVVLWVHKCVNIPGGVH